MGFTKRLLGEQDDGGFSLRDPFRVACPTCIADEGLKLFVSQHATDRACDFCGSADGYGLELQSLFRYIAGCLSGEYDDPNDGVGWDGREGGWQGVDPFDSDDLLRELDEPLAHDLLRSEFVRAFSHEWCQRDPYRLEYHEALASSWEAFAAVVRNDPHRELTSIGEETPSDDELFEPNRVLGEIGNTISNVEHHVPRTVVRGENVWRGRRHAAGEVYTTPGELGSPIAAIAGENRMTPAGVPVFYGSSDADTARREVLQTGDGDMVTVACWHVTEPIVYLDLASEIQLPTIFSQHGRMDRRWLRFLQRFAIEISQPYADPASAIDYLPTQRFTAYIRDTLRSANGSSVMAIRYRSAVPQSTGENWVVFVGSDECGPLDGGTLMQQIGELTVRIAVPPGPSR